MALPTTLAEIRALNSRAGLFFFEPGTMRFFRSRVSPGCYVGNTATLFVTSEQFDATSPRLYTVRACDAQGKINTVGRFQGYPNLRSARNAARAAASAPEASR